MTNCDELGYLVSVGFHILGIILIDLRPMIPMKCDQMRYMKTSLNRSVSTVPKLDQKTIHHFWSLGFDNNWQKTFFFLEVASFKNFHTQDIRC